MATELEIKQEKKIAELEAELEKIRQTLSMCANCHKIRDEKDAYHPIADYLLNQFGIKTSHGICPDCAKKLYPDFYKG
ncbi:MAG: hypothetical protein ABIG88_02425 [Patescibacteria group bacterium]|nr:hypothetical protein [Patescibacteria group bacterium]